MELAHSQIPSVDLAWLDLKRRNRSEGSLAYLQLDSYLAQLC